MESSAPFFAFLMQTLKKLKTNPEQVKRIKEHLFKNHPELFNGHNVAMQISYKYEGNGSYNGHYQMLGLLEER